MNSILNIRAGPRVADVRVEVRLDGSLAVRIREHYLVMAEFLPRPKAVKGQTAVVREAAAPLPQNISSNFTPPQLSLQKTGHFYLAETFLLGVDRGYPLDRGSSSVPSNHFTSPLRTRALES
jgi:hypothetical protein